MINTPGQGDPVQPTRIDPADPDSVSERLRRAMWRLGIWTAASLRRAGLWGPVCRPLIWLGQRIVPPPSSEVLAVLPMSAELKVPPGWPSSMTLASGRYEPELTALFLRSVRESMRVVDVGANIGYYTILASRLVGPTGHVVAFEPDRDAATTLRSNIEHNRCTNIDIVELAAAAEEGHAHLCVPQPEHGYLVHGGGKESDHDVTTTTLDRYFSNLDWPAVDIVKMDIEGGEESALAGMTRLCRRNPRIKLFLEINIAAMTRSGVALADFIDRLRSLGFTRARFIELDRDIDLLDDPLPSPTTHPQAMYNILAVQHVEDA